MKNAELKNKINEKLGTDAVRGGKNGVYWLSSSAQKMFWDVIGWGTGCRYRVSNWSLTKIAKHLGLTNE